MKYGLKRPRSTIRSARERGFTLTELLLAIMVVGILASLTMVVTSQAIYSAKVSKTKSTIAKLDVVISEMYENFETRRLPVRGLSSYPRFAHASRLWLLRDMMRMEMPNNWDEVVQPSIGFQFRANGVNSGNPVPSGSYVYLYYDDNNAVPVRSPLQQMYYNVYDAAIQRLVGDGETLTDAQAIVREHESAKCLYLIVTLGNPESREAFHDSEIATDPNDGLSFFIDGWRQPIGFLRWAPGLMDSDRQPMIRNDQDRIDAVEDFEDPLNPVRLYGGIQVGSFNGSRCIIDLDKEWTDADNVTHSVWAWALVPLIVSSGGEEDGYGLKRVGTVSDVIIDPVFDLDIGGPNNPANFNIITNHTSRR